MPVKPIPEGYQAVIPYLVVPGVARLIEFLQKAFGAELISKMTDPEGRVGHSEVRVAGCVVMMGEPMPPQYPPVPGALYLYVPNVDEVYKRAIAAGGTGVQPPEDKPYGDRQCWIKDPSGNTWWVATHVEDMSQEEMERRMKEKQPQPQ